MRRHSVPGDRHLPGGITILFEDADLIVIDKPSGLLSVPTSQDPSVSALEILENYVRKGQVKSRKELHPVNRLDRFTSGVLLFAKSLQMREKMHETWAESTQKCYLAVVHGRMEAPSGRVASNLAEDGNLMVYSTKNPDEGKLAVTEWTLLGQSPRYALLEVHPLTGRKNQIRVHMADLGHPIAGDRKYGGGGSGRDRLCLHAWKIAFRHPRGGAEMEFTSPIPPEFARLVPQRRA